MKKALKLLTLFVLLSTGFLYAQKTTKIKGPSGALITNDLEMYDIIPCTVNGVTITATGTNQSVLYTTPNIVNGCVNQSTSGFLAWTSWIPTGFITYTFSQPIISATIGYSVINNHDVGLMTINGSSPIQLSDACGVDIISSDTVKGNATGGTNPYGDVNFTVSSATPFTTITLTNISGNTGWVTGNLCKFKVSLPIIADPKYSYQKCASQFPTIIPSVFTNLGGSGNPITIGGAPASASNVVLTAFGIPPYLTLNANGTVTVDQVNAPLQMSEEFYFTICPVGGGVCTSPIRYNIVRDLSCRTATGTTVSVEPNPSRDSFVINFDTVKSDVQLEVYDFYGKVYLKTQITKLNNYTINAQDYPKGMYVLKIIDKEGVTTKQLIKE